MGNLHPKEVIEKRQWSLQFAAAIMRNAPLSALFDQAEFIYKWTAVRPDGK